MRQHNTKLGTCIYACCRNRSRKPLAPVVQNRMPLEPRLISASFGSWLLLISIKLPNIQGATALCRHELAGLKLLCLIQHVLLLFLLPILRGGVGITQRYSAGLRAGWSGVQFPAGVENFTLHHRVQIGSGPHPASYPVGTRGCFSGGKAAGA
jgi:hypothetical protein